MATQPGSLLAIAPANDMTSGAAMSLALKLRQPFPRTPTDVSAADGALVFAAQPKRAGCVVGRCIEALRTAKVASYEA